MDRLNSIYNFKQFKTQNNLLFKNRKNEKFPDPQYPCHIPLHLHE